MSEHLRGDQVVPYSGCNNTLAWRDATELELTQNERIHELEDINAVMMEALEDTMRIIGPPESAQWSNVDEDEINAAWNSAVAAIAKAKG